MAISFWAASLVAFFSFFRKSTLSPKTLSHSCKTEICLSDLTQSQSGFLLKIKHTKTLQYHQSLLYIPLPVIKGSPLCPTKALQSLLAQLSHCSPSAPLFSSPSSQGSFNFVTHSSFTAYLKKALKMSGYSPSLYSGHSFRRGGGGVICLLLRHSLGPYKDPRGLELRCLSEIPFFPTYQRKN